MVVSHMPPTGDLACNPGMCPDWEQNWRQFGFQASAQSTESQLLERINESPWYAIRWVSLPILTMRQQYLFLCNIFTAGHTEGYVCALLLPTNTTAAELFNSLSDYIIGKLNQSFGVSICMDGVAAMTGWLSGFTTQVNEAASEYESTHYVIEKCWLAKKCYLNLTTFCRM